MGRRDRPANSESLPAHVLGESMAVRRMRWLSLVLMILSALLGACDDDEKESGKPDSDASTGSSCSVAELPDGSVRITCDDGTTATIRPPASADDGGVGACSVTRDENTVTITCPNGSSTSFEVGGGAVGADAGPGHCTVRSDDAGVVTITCPDGSSVVIPGEGPVGDGGVHSDGGSTQQARILTGATRAACGGCHDSKAARAHFTAMTVEVDGELQETCGTCHNETSIEPVTRVHARPEVAPGFKVTIQDVQIDANRKAVVSLALTDAANQPLSHDGVSWNFLIARVPAETPAMGTGTIAGPYINYATSKVTQQDTPYFPLNGQEPRIEDRPGTERNGTFTETGNGLYTYTFATALPQADYDSTETHMVAVYATLTIDGVRYVANAAKSFVPADTSATPLVRETVTTASCNKCHNPLSAHGGSRQEVQLCLGCHSQGAKDPESGNSIDFNVMVHRIHMGADLPSVKGGTPYRIIGNALSLHDFSEVKFPRPIVHCQSCHDTSDDRWVTNGTRAACTSCHDNIDKPAAEGGHPFQLNPNATCGNAACHSPGGNVADAREAHTTFLNLDNAPVFDVQIVSILVDNPDVPPSVRISAHTGTRATGAVTPVTSVDNFSMLNVFVNGPNQGFAANGNTIVQFNKQSLLGFTADGSQPGHFTFTLPKTLRELVQGLGDPDLDSYTMSVRAAYDPTPGVAPDNDRVDMLRNPTKAFTAAEELVTRTYAVDTDKCNNCHGVLQAHGGANLAKNIEQCVMCHTATLDTRGRQGASQVPGPTTSLRFSTLVHRVHAGHVAELPYEVFGHSSAPPYPVVDLSHVGFPGDLRDCTSCHTAGGYTLPLPQGSPPSETIVLDDNGNPISN